MAQKLGQEHSAWRAELQHQFKERVKHTAVVLDSFEDPSLKKCCGYFIVIISLSFNLIL